MRSPDRHDDRPAHVAYGRPARTPTGAAEMSPDLLAFTILAAVAPPHSSDRAAAMMTLAVMGVLQLAVMVVLWRAFRWHGPDGDPPGSDGDGPGRGPRPPREPPPDQPTWWPEFEREFAEHVEVVSRGRPATSAPSRRGERANARPLPPSRCGGACARCRARCGARRRSRARCGPARRAGRPPAGASTMPSRPRRPAHGGG